MAGKNRQGKNEITLARALSKLGIASRTQAAEMIRAGRVGVNSRIVRSPVVWVDPKKDNITLDAEPLRQKKLIYLAMNKPVGVVTTRSDERGRGTVYDLLSNDSRWLFPVGRLDKDSSGLLLFTNDTRFGDKVTSPSGKVPKTYLVQVDKVLQPYDCRLMQSSFVLSDGTVLRPAKVTVDDGCKKDFRIT
ncbi:MAG: pseudouridine synthase, partial [Bacteroidota bacterium]